MLPFEEMLANVSEETESVFWEFHFIAIKAILLLVENQEYVAYLERISTVYGLSVPSHFRAVVTRFYFESMFGGYAFNPRNIYELSLPNPSKSKQELVRNIFNSREINLHRFSAYRNAWVYNDALSQALHHAQSSSDPALQSLAEEHQRIKTKVGLDIKKRWEQMTMVGITSSWQCPYCGDFLSFERKTGVSEAPPHCGEIDCRRAYEREKFNRRNFDSKHGTKRPSNRSKTFWKAKSLDMGWVPSSDKPSRCSKCGKRRILNNERQCGECFVKTYSLNEEAKYPENA